MPARPCLGMAVSVGCAPRKSLSFYLLVHNMLRGLLCARSSTPT
jgi:hypothetical protein